MVLKSIKSDLLKWAVSCSFVFNGAKVKIHLIQEIYSPMKYEINFKNKKIRKFIMYIYILITSDRDSNTWNLCIIFSRHFFIL